MGKQITLRFPAYPGASATTTHEVWSDKATSGAMVLVDTVAPTQNANSGYGPILSQLEAAFLATDDVAKLLSGTENDFPAGTYVTIGRELLKLGTPDATPNWYEETIERGLGGTLKAAHASGATVYRVHLSYVDPNVEFGSRHLIRYHIIAVHGGVRQVPLELAAYSPSMPEDNSLCMVYGSTQDIIGVKMAGLEVSVVLDTGDLDYLVGTSEILFPEERTVNSDADGYFQLPLHKDVVRNYQGAYTLTIKKAQGSKTVTIASVPNQNVAHILNVL